MQRLEARNLQDSNTPSASPATFRRIKPQPLALAPKSASSTSLVKTLNEPVPQVDNNQNTPTTKALNKSRDELNKQVLDSQGGLIKFSINELEFVGKLGSGSGGTVSKVLHSPTGLLLAKKVPLFSNLLIFF